jgi:hypothetical protein
VTGIDSSFARKRQQGLCSLPEKSKDRGMAGEQLDLFDSDRPAVEPVSPQKEVAPDLAALADAALIDALPAPVADAAACALGRIGRAEARPRLMRLLHAAPSAEIVEAIMPIADRDAPVILDRIACTRPDLAAAALAALDGRGS